jgi:hypothetical protein
MTVELPDAVRPAEQGGAGNDQVILKHNLRGPPRQQGQARAVGWGDSPSRRWAGLSHQPTKFSARQTQPRDAAAYKVRGYRGEVLGCREDILKRLHNIPYGQFVFEHILTHGYSYRYVAENSRVAARPSRPVIPQTGPARHAVMRLDAAT